jgi:NAD(P)-dependent dehydrogenase (short-subunit alcohol dehydrogenase family)/ketosteroid isomerase-like protein
MFISGASRGIGLAIALRAARDGANVALVAKTAEPHPKLEGTVYTAAEQIEQAGGKALPIVGDIRDEDQVASAVAQAVDRFGGIDICVNNASAINLAGTEALELKRYDLMQDINVRGTFAVGRACIPHLRNGKNPHILNLSPPISLEPKWLGPHIGYTLAKYGMTMCALGWAAELADDGSPPTRCGRARSSPPRRCRTCSVARRRWPSRAGPSSTPTPPTRCSPARAASAPATRSCARTSSPRRASPTCRPTPTSRAPSPGRPLRRSRVMAPRDPVDVVRVNSDAFSAQDIDGMLVNYAEDAVVRDVRHGGLLGTFTGHDELRTFYLGIFHMARWLREDLEVLAAEGETVVAECELHGQLAADPGGRETVAPYGLLVTVRDGLIRELVIHGDGREALEVSGLQAS